MNNLDKQPIFESEQLSVAKLCLENAFTYLHREPNISHPKNLVSPEMDVALDKGDYRLMDNFSALFLDKSGNRTTYFLKNLMEMYKNRFPDAGFLYIDLKGFNSTSELVKALASFEIWALSSNNHDMREYVKKYLSECDCMLTSCYDKKGLGYKMCDVYVHENFMEISGGLEDIAVERYGKDGRLLCFFLDHAERIEELDDAKEMVSFIQSHLLGPQNKDGLFRVAIASSSEKVNKWLNSGKNKFHEVELTSFSKSVRKTIKDYLKRGIEGGDLEQSLDRICDICGSNLTSGLELAMITKLTSENWPTVDDVNLALNYLLQRRKSLYLQQTNSLSEDAQHLLKLLSDGWSISDLIPFDRNKDESKQIFKPAIDELLGSGILIERDGVFTFTDPIYQYWIKYGRYPVIGYKKRKEKDPQFISLAYPTR